MKGQQQFRQMHVVRTHTNHLSGLFGTQPLCPPRSPPHCGSPSTKLMGAVDEHTESITGRTGPAAPAADG